MNIENLLAKTEQKHIKQQLKQGYPDAKFSPRLKYFKRLKTFKLSNVEFNPNTMIATSYDWWEFVKKINGYVVFNDYSYSVSTRKHQHRVTTLLNQLGINIDIYIESPKGLQNLNSSVEFYKNKIVRLHQAVMAKGSKKKKNAERLQDVEFFKSKIKQVEMLMKCEKKHRLGIYQ